MNASIPVFRLLALTLIGFSLVLASGCETKRTKSADRIERESGTLWPRAGYRGDRLGVEVESVSDSISDEWQTIDLILPLSPEMVDDVEVIGPEGRLLELKSEPLIRPDPDERGVGLRLFLPKQNNLEFRLRLIDLPEN